MIRKLIFGVFAVLGALILVMLGNTFLTPSKQLQVAPEKPVTVDSVAAASRLSAAVKLQTISSATDSEASADKFKALHQHIETSDPKLHAVLKRERVGAYGLLYTWPGSDAKAKGIALSAHQDVVPVAPSLMLGATDSRYFDDIADNVYKFSPVRAGPNDLVRFHGTNERISVANYTEMIQFYFQLLKNATGAPVPAAS